MNYSYNYKTRDLSLSVTLSSLDFTYLKQYRFPPARDTSLKMLCGVFRKRLPVETADFTNQSLREVPPDLYEHRRSLQRLYLNTNYISTFPKVILSPGEWRHGWVRMLSVGCSLCSGSAVHAVCISGQLCLHFVCYCNQWLTYIITSNACVIISTSKLSSVVFSSLLSLMSKSEEVHHHFSCVIYSYLISSFYRVFIV